MRMAFGLAGILITIGVIVMVLNYAILPYNQTVVKEGNKAREEAEQLSGQQDGMRTSESVTLEPQASGGRTTSLLVTRLVTGGPMETYFGLKRNDSIVEVSGMKVRDLNDGEMAVAQALEAYQRKGTLTVVRDGRTITLPNQTAAGTAATAGTAAAPQAPQQGAGQTEGSGGSSLQNQLDAIQKIKTH